MRVLHSVKFNAIVVAYALLLIMVTGTLLFKRMKPAKKKNYSELATFVPGYESYNTTTPAYRGSDYPQTWDIGELEKVQLAMENSHHYAIDTPLGIAEWNATLPANGGILYLGDDLRPFSISMFHQLRCLNIIRKAIITQDRKRKERSLVSEALTHHCMNYIRQMILCRANLRLESVRRSVGSHVTVPYVTHTCNDWTAVYEAAERNYEDFLELRKNTKKQQ